MAGLCSRRLLLLWAGIAALATCEGYKNESATSPLRTLATSIATASDTKVVLNYSLTSSPPTSNTSFQSNLSATITVIPASNTSNQSLPTPTSSSTSSVPQNQNQTTPPVIQSNTTMAAPTTDESATSPLRTLATSIATASYTKVVLNSSLTSSPPTSNTSFQSNLSAIITVIPASNTSNQSLPTPTSSRTSFVPQNQNQTTPPLIQSNTTMADPTTDESATSPLRTVATSIATASYTKVVLNSSLTSSPPTSNTSFQSNLSAIITVIPASNTSNQSLPTPTSSSTSSVPQNQNQTTPPLIQSNTTVAAPTTGTQTTAGPSPQCFYQVQHIPGGFLINITNSPVGNYIITITENNQTVKQENVFVSHENATHEIKHLKPCTEYEHSVVHADRGITCNSDANKAKTQWIDDIKEISNTSGYVCYQSPWNLNFSVSPSKNHRYEQREDGKLCFKLADEDFCSDFNINFTPENCNETFHRTRYISVDFIDPNAIVQREPTGLPAKIETKLPSNCKNFMVDYTCSESGKVNQSINLSDVEPFTDYICTGLIQHNNVSIKTPRLQFQITCDLTITVTKPHGTNTSTELTWKTSSNNCEGFPQNFTRFSYTLNCPKSSGPGPCKSIKPDGGTCELTGLSPYTDYKCEIQPTYNNRKVSKPETFTWKTEPATYTLEVVAFNAALKSKPATKQVPTRCTY
ncbi:uncharacterized protein DDB_G0290587-like isoform X2 [Melanotaenia boesemani]|uniref:uncharacterized protein DDB_G0290587-like isoform X2 n=1 Tax=Melanotaenia boesemani TaxID=1250792 RepID=UPI001C0444C4|nr:uncharacterized protein DDB_G0290587-like isoform X2 [Melanotaenia boesemani]